MQGAAVRGLSGVSKEARIPELKSEYYTPCMQKLDKLGWSHGNSYTAFGCDVGLRANSADALEEISKYVPCWIKPSPSRSVDRVVSFIKGGRKGSQRLFNLLYLDHALVARSHDFASIKDHLTDGIEIALAEKAKSHIVLHAGAVSWKGRGILIPGPSHSGKSTLVAELLKQGAVYYSDEFVAINQYGKIEPLGRPLQLRNKESNRRNIVTATEIGAKSANVPVSISLVLFAEYQELGKFKALQIISSGLGIFRLMENCFTARTRPEGTLECLEKVVEGAKVISLSRGEANVAAGKILQSIEEDSVY